MKSSEFRKEVNFFSLSFIALFVIWVILSGYFDTFFILCGTFSSILTLFILRRLINSESVLHQILNDPNRLAFYRLASYIPWIMYQIILSSIYVSKRILQPKYKLEPIIIQKKCKDHNDQSITLFANSVTITPGTLTINVERKQQIYLSTICLIDKALESGIDDIENKALKILSTQPSKK